MGYAGKTYQIPYDKGGFTYNENTDLVAPNMMVAPSRNVNLHRNGRGKRGGTTKVNGTAVSGAPRIMGLFDFQLAASSFQVFAANDGKVYKNTTTTIKTGMSTSNFFSFAVMAQELYIADGASTVQTWDGAAAGTSNITTPAGDWATTPPIQMIAHGRGASRRMWAIAGTKVYYSSLANGKEFSGGTSGSIQIDTQDAYGLVGGVEFGNRLIVFDRRQAYIIDDESTTLANWGYAKAQWKGGAAHWRGLQVIDNDLLVLSEDGQVYSLQGAQQYGDYTQATLTRPAFIDIYIKDNLDVTSINNWHMAFDRSLRAVKLFVTRSGQLTNDTALVYFVDRGPGEGWAIHDNQSSVSGYSASCSAEVRTAAGTYLLYTGSYTGFLWKLEQSTKNDDSVAYYGGVKTPNLNLEDSRLRKHFRQLRVIMKSQGAYSLQVNVWIDGNVVTAGTISMAGSGAALDSFILDTSTLGGVEFIDGRLELNHVGKRIQFEFYNNGLNQDFFLSHLLLDFKALPSTI